MVFYTHDLSLTNLDVSGTLIGSLTGNADTATKISSINNSDIVQLAAHQTLSNKTLTAPNITGLVITDASLSNLDVSGEITTNDLNITGVIKMMNPDSITQPTSKTTSVTCNKRSMKIILHDEAINTNNTKTFTVNNSTILSGDVIFITNDGSVGNGEDYLVWGHTVLAANSFKISIKNISGSTLSHAIVLNIMILNVDIS